MSNTLTYVTPKLLANGLLALRENAIMSRLVNRDYENEGRKRGNVIDIPVPSAIAARAVTPAVTVAANVDSSPTEVAVTLDQWYEAPFQLSDNDALTAFDDFQNMQAGEAVKALVNTIDDHIWGKHTGAYSIVGAAGTTPFATNITLAASARTLLNKNLCPPGDRRGVLDPSAEGNFLVSSPILNANERGDQGAVINGTIGRKLGVDWYMDQNLSTFTPGTAWVTNWTFAGIGTLGVYTISALCTTSGTVLVGDIFSYNGQQYVITTAATAVTATALSLTIYPALVAAVVSGEAFTVQAASAYTVNLMFHRNAFAFVSRPLLDSADGLGSEIMAGVDPISGIAMRLERSRQYKQTTYSYDALWGSKCVRPEFVAKIMG